MNRKIINKTVFISIAKCIIKITYTKKTKVIHFLKDFIVSRPTSYDYLIKFASNIGVLVNNDKDQQKNSIILPHEINRYAFQYFVRNVLQDFLGKNKSGFFLHCSGVLMGNKAYLFLGPQSSGKSTISRMLSGVAQKLVDDSGIIIKENKNFYLYQTPFIEKRSFVKSYKGYLIDKIFFISKSKKFMDEVIIRNLRKTEALDLFIKQLWTDKKRLNIQLKIAMQFVNDFTQFYKLDFPKNKIAVNNWFVRFSSSPISNCVPAHLRQNNYEVHP